MKSNVQLVFHNNQMMMRTEKRCSHDFKFCWRDELEHVMHTSRPVYFYLNRDPTEKMLSCCRNVKKDKCKCMLTMIGRLEIFKT